MGKNLLVAALRSNDEARGKGARNYFECNASVISYSTGIPVLDYNLGYKVSVYDAKGKFVESYPSIGITAGTIVSFVGKPGTGKTSAAVKFAGNIVRKFDNGSVIHYDIERAMNYSRVQALTKLSMPEMKDGKYIIRQEKTALDDLKASILDLYLEKVSKPDIYKYHTGKLNEFGDEIIMYEPTVVIIDSIGSIVVGLEDGTKKSIEKAEEVSSQTDRMRLTGEIGRFFNELLPYCTEANITVFAINQIKDRPPMGIIQKPAQILGLQADESVPGGWTPLFLSQILIKFEAVTSDKYTVEEDGFSGFKINAKIIKSRVSSALRNCELIYDRNTGIDMLRSTVEFAKNIGVIGGNRAGYYFLDNKDLKFKQKTMGADFREHPELYKMLKDVVIPALEPNLSGISQEEMIIPDEEANFYDL